jgi:hypothetical protein
MRISTGRAAVTPAQALLAALDRPETAFSLSYRLGLDTEVCRQELESLVRTGAVARRGAEEAAVYVRVDRRLPMANRPQLARP